MFGPRHSTIMNSSKIKNLMFSLAAITGLGVVAHANSLEAAQVSQTTSSVHELVSDATAGDIVFEAQDKRRRRKRNPGAGHSTLASNRRARHFHPVPQMPEP